ncbi:MAG: DUF1080 domain-containing protein [Planctomycetota bacterium]|nr:MAG: DUF1080 domain-containing protein [Planctomycetota bacterium]REK39552.1 MAG: DUF1080 domain-containing protein [Planctomycetota bacterium]
MNQRPRRLTALALCCALWITSGCSGPAADEQAGPQQGESLSTPAAPRDATANEAVAEAADSKSNDDSSEAAAPYHNPLSAEEIAEGWISLFDGHTLFGWEANNDEVNWRVADGAITADEGPAGLLNTTSPFADFELVCEFRMEAGGNSGVFLRTVAHPTDPSTDCYELNIADEHPDGFTTGAIVAHAKTDEPIAGSGDWKTFRIRAEGNHIVVELDGTEVLDYTDDSAARAAGRIGLQKNEGRIEFRKVIVRPLGLTDLFNGEDLTGWRVVPGSKSEFTVEDGVIRVVDGAGFLETEQTFGDFIFQAEAITHGDALNSGYFFRALEGTENAPSHGYEVQIHNGYLNNDRTQPANAGTGAIFRRNEARRVVSNDHEWFTTTLIAAGNHIAVWVDGYQVTDWNDEREPDENPRQGRRDEAGHISLQGHDPTTDLSFRNLRAVELPESAVSAE